MILLSTRPARVIRSAANTGVLSLCLLGTLTIAAGSLCATPITGILQITPTSPFGVDANTTDFNYHGGTPSDATFGTFTVSSASTGSFAPYIGDAGLVRSFSRSTVPLGTPTSYANFIQLPSPTPTIEFILTELFAGTQPLCAVTSPPQSSCTPALSPFDLQNGPGNPATSSSATFFVDVEAINLLTGETSNGTGTFSAPIDTMNIQQVVATIESGGVVGGNVYSDNFTLTFSGSSTPEPPSMVFVAGGLLVMISAVRRKITGFRKDR